MQPLLSCRTCDLKNLLYLSESKIRPKTGLPLLDILGSFTHLFDKNLSVIFDITFEFGKQIKSVVKTGLSQLRLLNTKPHLVYNGF